MDIIAHRGRIIPFVAGNTILDFEEAVKLGVYAIETDVSLTLDDVPIIYHPGSTDPDCTSMAWHDIFYYPNELHYPKEPDSAQRPKVINLDRFLIFMECHTKMRSCLELKQNSLRLVASTVEKIIAKNLQDRIYLTAFETKFRYLSIETNADLLLAAKGLDRRIKTHLITMFPFDLYSIVQEYHPDAISIGWLTDSKLSRFFFKFIVPLVNLKEQIKEIQKKNIPVWGGIINNLEDMKYFNDLGVDAIMTDDAMLGMRFKNELKNSA